MQYFFLIYILMLICSCEKQIVSPMRGDIVEAVYGLGTVKSEENFSAKVAVTSSVLEFFVTEGQDIKKGQKLLKTDQGALIHSPFNGRVTNIPFSIKENIFPQTTISSVVNLKKLYLTVSLEQQAIMRIRPNLKAEVSFDFFRNEKIPGKITSIFTASDQFIAKVELLKWPEGVLPGMTADVAIENVLLPTRKNNQLKRKEAFARELMSEIGLANKSDRLPANLSGGEQQRVVIARALIMQPKYLFSDEPTGNLDSTNGKLIQDLFEKFNHEYGTTIVYVTHDEEFGKRAPKKLQLVDGVFVT